MTHLIRETRRTKCSMRVRMAGLHRDFITKKYTPEQLKIIAEEVNVYLLNNPTRREVRDACQKLGCTNKQFKKRIKKARRLLVKLEQTMHEQPRLEGL